jgi:hypothetical protein
MTPTELIEYKNKSQSVAYHKFVIISNKHGNSFLYCFFEGKEDCPYYQSRTMHYFENFEPFICNGKGNVIDLFLKIKEIPKYKSYKISYFIDHDFGPPTNIPEIYETPTYSIENFYCSAKCFANILKAEFNITIDDPQFGVCMNLFKNRQIEFHKSIVFINAWYCCVKNKATEQNIKLGICLNDNTPNGFVNFDFSVHITHSYGIRNLKSMYPTAPIVSNKEVSLYKNKFKDSDMTKTLRGKYELEFIKKFLRFLITDANTKTSRNYIKKRTSFNFQDNLFLSQLSQYADTPNCLIKYMAKLK